MKKFLLFAFAILICNFGFSQRSEYYFKFKINNKSEIKTITRQISIDNYRNDTIWAYANQTELTKFKQLGYNLEILPAPSSQAKVLNMATTVDEMVNWDKYPTYEVYVEMMNKFVTDYPTLCKLENIGTTIDGRSLLVLKLTDNPDIEENEAEFFYSSTIHGDETTGMVLTLRMMDYLLSHYNQVGYEDATYILNNTELWVCPDANPDGTYAGGNSTISGSQRYNANGSDLNRNFPDPVEGQNPTGAWQPETIAMMNFAQAHNFTMGGNFHGGAEVMNFPWDAWLSVENMNPDDSWFRTICTEYVTLARQINLSFMSDVTASGVTEGADWYSVAGGRQDYMNYWHHCKEVTIEVSSEKTLSTDQLNYYWDINKNSLLAFVKQSTYGIHGTVTNISNQPLAAKIFINSHDKDGTEVYCDAAVGDYHRPIAAGTYSVTYSCEGYISQTMNISVTNNNTTINNVVLLQAALVTVTGTVTEGVAKTPIEGATIQLLNTSIPSVTTGADGTFTINNVPENTYNIKAYKINYAAQNQNINITTTNNIVNFSLFPSNAISFELEVPTGWTFTGGNWTRATDQAYDGNYSMKSASIANSGTTTMTVTKNSQAGEISFYKKVSSEATFDFLRFYIDGTQMGEWSGEVDWSQQTYTVTAGNHTYKWEYSKDNAETSGSDCAWVDYVTLPADFVIINYNITFNVTNGTTPIENANITLNTYGTQQTNFAGTTVFNSILQSNSLTYTVQATNYVTKNGSLVVDASKTIDVQLDLINKISDTNILLKLLPNPSNGIFVLENNLDSKINIQIYNQLGQIIMEKNNVSDNKIQINMFDQSKGIYFMKIYVDGKVFNKKFVIQ